MAFRLARAQFAALGGTARIKKISTPRRRLPVTVFPDAAREVEIRHIGQELGSLAKETYALLNQNI
jgi:hypothetical protein